MTFSRFKWRMAYWPALVLNRVFGVSYKWVNAGRGAWREDLYNPLWHHEWYGSPIPAIPNEVVLRGIGYRVSSHEGLVQFVSDSPFCHTISFTRDPHDPHAHLWDVATSKPVSAEHIVEAYGWVKAVYGGPFEKR